MIRNRRAFITAAFVIGATASFPVIAVDTPTSLPGAEVVTVAQAKALYDAGVMFIDNRVIGEYTEGHIQNAISVPYKERSAKAVDFDPNADQFALLDKVREKTSKLIMYCNGPSCWKSYKATKFAVQNGYKNVYWLRDGYFVWKAAGYPVE